MILESVRFVDFETSRRNIGLLAGHSFVSQREWPVFVQILLDAALFFLVEFVNILVTFVVVEADDGVDVE